VKVDRFLAERGAEWSELESLLDSSGGRPERLGAAGVLRLGGLYRAAAADLAVARRHLPGDPVVARLEHLVARGRQAVYADEAKRASPLRFLATDYWRLVAERRTALLIAAALLLVPAVLAAVWAVTDPGAALGLVPEDFRQAVEPVGDTGMSSTETAAFSSEVLTNNIQVTFTSFALGLLAGFGTAFIVAYNGLILGVIAGGAIDAGNGIEFVEFVFAHGVIELTCIVVAAAAGMRMGWALIDPGPRRRGAALAAEAREAVVIVLGTAPWLVLAGFIEGFVTRSGFGLVPGIVLGLLVGGAYWTLVVVRGRPG
jgi:uncharacterized membrane protein SpoIIM required for sporulation